MPNYRPPHPPRDTLTPVDRLENLNWEDRILALERWTWRFVLAVNEWALIGMDDSAVLVWAAMVSAVWVSRTLSRP